MNLIEKVLLAGKVLQAGESLKDSSKWKNVQLLINPFLLILGSAVQVLDLDISQSDINSISYGLATLAVAVNSYLTLATSDKVGYGH